MKADEHGQRLAHACVSAGNTGALMAMSRYVLKTLEGVDRPAIATVMPNQQDRYTTVLDLGANVDCSAEHLLQFAVMAAPGGGCRRPGIAKVGLLNIGEKSSRAARPSKKAKANCCGGCMSWTC